MTGTVLRTLNHFQNNYAGRALKTGKHGCVYVNIVAALA